MKHQSIELLLLDTLKESLAALRRRCSNVRYGPPGKILFDFDGVTYWTAEPKDVLPVGAGDVGLRWAVRQYLLGAEKYNP